MQVKTQTTPPSTSSTVFNHIEYKAKINSFCFHPGYFLFCDIENLRRNNNILGISEAEDVILLRLYSQPSRKTFMRGNVFKRDTACLLYLLFCSEMNSYWSLLPHCPSSYPFMSPSSRPLALTISPAPPEMTETHWDVWTRQLTVTVLDPQLLKQFLPTVIELPLLHYVLHTSQMSPILSDSLWVWDQIKSWLDHKRCSKFICQRNPWK